MPLGKISRKSALGQSVPLGSGDTRAAIAATHCGAARAGAARAAAKAACCTTTLKMVDRCAVCGEPYGHYRTDDAAPWLTILVVGHLTVPLILISEMNFQPPIALALAIYLPLIVGLTLFLLPRCKGVMAAMLWAMKRKARRRFEGVSAARGRGG